MPLSEFYGTSKGKVEGSRSTDRAFVPNTGLVELVCENGHIMMQDQSFNRKAPKIPPNSFPYQTPTFLDKEENETASKVGKYRTYDSIYSAPTPPAPSGEPVLNQDDDMAQWFSYPIEDSLQQDYCSDFLPELSGVTVHESSMRNSIASIEKRDRYDQVGRSSDNGSARASELSLGQGSALKPPPSKYASLYPWSLPQGQTSVSSVGSRVSDIPNDVSGNLVSSQAPGGHLSHTKVQKQDSGLPRSNSSLLNFSHFSRPAAMARANIQNASSVSALGTSAAGRMIENDKPPLASGRNPAEAAQLDPNCALRKELNYHTPPDFLSTKVDLKRAQTIQLEESHPRGRADAVLKEDASNKDKTFIVDRTGNSAKGVLVNEKAGEPVGASSSVCSGNSVERTSNDRRITLKRKPCRDTEESEGQSEDVEEESMGVKKAPPARGGSGSKRSRAAEVHNLSERRRRDRINEKMRALQELIPNCNKVDKASMLDEAIEYLKTLQLQVQIMSMGAGMYMPPMMLPTGMQHMHAAHLPHFSPMGVGMGMGMGMGMGFGMNMLDMNVGPRGCSMIPMSSMQGAHFPSPPMSASANFQGVAGGNPPVFGHPSKGFPMSVAGGHLTPVSGQHPANSATGTISLKMGVNVEASNAVPAPTIDSKNTNLQDMHSTDARISLNQQSSQFHATNEEFEQSALVQKTDQGPDVCGTANDNSTRNNDTLPIRDASSD